MSFEQTLKGIQKQLEIDKKIFKETGCMSELLIRVHGFNINQKGDNNANKKH